MLLDYVFIIGSELSEEGFRIDELLNKTKENFKKADKSFMIIGDGERLLKEEEFQCLKGQVSNSTKIIILAHGINYQACYGSKYYDMQFDDTHHIQIFSSIDIDDVLDNPKLLEETLTSKFLSIFSSAIGSNVPLEVYLNSCYSGAAANDVLHLPNSSKLVTFSKPNEYGFAWSYDVLINAINTQSELGDLYLKLLTSNIIDISLNINQKGEMNSFAFNRPFEKIEKHIQEKQIQFIEFAKNNSIKVTSEFLINKHSIEESLKYLFIESCAKGNIEAIKYLISQDPQLINNYKVNGYEDLNPVKLALNYNQKEILRFLLEKELILESEIKEVNELLGKEQDINSSFI